MNWRLAELWNSVATKENRHPEKRDYMYASEIMYPKIDRFLKMNGVEYTNPPNDRSLRKFFAGNVWEYIVKSILITTGAYRQDEVRVNLTTGNNLPVHGRLDFLAGGIVDSEFAYMKLSEQNYPDFLQKVGEGLIEALSGKELDKKILELKSVSLYALEYVEKRRSPMNTHMAQAYHYQLGTNIPASIAYISKDTALMAEFEIDEAVAGPMYLADLEEMTYYFLKGERPPAEPLLSFDMSIGKFTKNLGVEYSPYLTFIYGFSSPDDYRRAVDGKTARWNNTLNRYAMIEAGAKTATGRDMKLTPKNEEGRREIIEEGFDFKELLRYKIEHMDQEASEEE